MSDLDGTERTLVLDESEIASIASEMARAYAGMVRYYREAYGLTVEEAEKKTRELIESAKGDDRALTGPSDQVSWYELMELMEHEPKKAVAAWERVKHAAREELASGHRAATAIHGVHGSPWDRARLLAIREAFRKEWQPSNGIEAALIDTLAQAHYAYLFWLERLMGRAIGQVKLDEGDLRWEGRWRPPPAGGSRGDTSGSGDGGPLQQAVYADFAGTAGFEAVRNQGDHPESAAGEHRGAAGERGG